MYFRRNWKKLFGALAFIWQVATWLLDYGGRIDFAMQHSENPGWIAQMIQAVLNPPHWVSVLISIFGLIFVFYDFFYDRYLKRLFDKMDAVNLMWIGSFGVLFSLLVFCSGAYWYFSTGRIPDKIKESLEKQEKLSILNAHFVEFELYKTKYESLYGSLIESFSATYPPNSHQQGMDISKYKGELFGAASRIDILAKNDFGVGFSYFEDMKKYPAEDIKGAKWQSDRSMTDLENKYLERLRELAWKIHRGWRA